MFNGTECMNKYGIVKDAWECEILGEEEMSDACKWYANMFWRGQGTQPYINGKQQLKIVKEKKRNA